MLGAAVMLGIVRWVTGDEEPPKAEVPSVGWEDARDVVGEEIPEPTEEPVTEPEPTDEPANEPTNEPEEELIDQLPAEFNLALPFTSQAPYGNWDAVHEETCEEASFLMVVEYFKGTAAGKLDPAVADAAMLDLVAYEEERGYGVSISAAEAVAIIEDYYPGYNAEIIENPTVEQLKQLLVDGYPVIVPAAGRELGNPFFTGEGPLYHMLVLRGYTNGRFVTNDPGTRHGENYTYDADVLMAAIGDWNNGNPPDGASRVIVMKPE